MFYMDKPDGSADDKHRGNTCLLNKALNDTKQAARVCNHRLTHTLKAKGLRVRLPIYVFMCDDRVLNLAS